MFKTALNILKTLNDAGFESYIIGGYPRNTYLKLNSTDIDICTSATINDIKKFYKDIKYKNYGSMLLTYNNFNYDITTFRKEIKYHNNRYPDYEYTTNIIDDIKRRDFTINTLCIDYNGNYIDFNVSKNDLNNKIIRTIGNPDKRLKEDVLRILRAIRFATELNFKLDEQLEKSIKKHAYLLDNLSFNRKKDELDKIFKSKNVIYGLQLIKKLHLEKYLNISINNPNATHSYIGIWYQLEPSNLYPFNKLEKQLLKKIDNLIYSHTDYDLYLSDKKTLEIVSEIINIDLIKKYNKLPIKDFKDIDINIKQLIDLDLSKDVTSIKNDISKKIINSELVNNYKNIETYLLKNYRQ